MATMEAFPHAHGQQGRRVTIIDATRPDGQGDNPKALVVPADWDTLRSRICTKIGLASTDAIGSITNQEGACIEEIGEVFHGDRLFIHAPSSNAQRNGHTGRTQRSHSQGERPVVDGGGGRAGPESPRGPPSPHASNSPQAAKTYQQTSPVSSDHYTESSFSSTLPNGPFQTGPFSPGPFDSFSSTSTGVLPRHSGSSQAAGAPSDSSSWRERSHPDLSAANSAGGSDPPFLRSDKKSSSAQTFDAFLMRSGNSNAGDGAATLTPGGVCVDGSGERPLTTRAGRRSLTNPVPPSPLIMPHQTSALSDPNSDTGFYKDTVVQEGNPWDSPQNNHDDRMLGMVASVLDDDDSPAQRKPPTNPGSASLSGWSGGGHNDGDARSESTAFTDEVHSTASNNPSHAGEPDLALHRFVAGLERNPSITSSQHPINSNDIFAPPSNSAFPHVTAVHSTTSDPSIQSQSLLSSAVTKQFSNSASNMGSSIGTVSNGGAVTSAATSEATATVQFPGLGATSFPTSAVQGLVRVPPVPVLNQREQGVIADMKRNYGFIQPYGRDEQVFFHIGQLVNETSGRVGDLTEYTIVVNPSTNKLMAINVVIISKAMPPRRPPSSSLAFVPRLVRPGAGGERDFIELTQLQDQGLARFIPLISILQRHHAVTGWTEMEMARVGGKLASIMPNWKQELDIERLKDYITQGQTANLINVRHVGLQHYVSIDRSPSGFFDPLPPGSGPSKGEREPTGTYGGPGSTTMGSDGKGSVGGGVEYGNDPSMVLASMRQYGGGDSANNTTSVTNASIASTASASSVYTPSYGKGASGVAQASGPRLSGIVKFIKDSYGFVLCHHYDEDLFYHSRNVEGNTVLQEGDHVEFNVALNTKTGKTNAVRVKLIERPHGSSTGTVPTPGSLGTSARGAYGVGFTHESQDDTILTYPQPSYQHRTQQGGLQHAGLYHRRGSEGQASPAQQLHSRLGPSSLASGDSDVAVAQEQLAHTSISPTSLEKAATLDLPAPTGSAITTEQQLDQQLTLFVEFCGSRIQQAKEPASYGLSVAIYMFDRIHIPHTKVISTLIGKLGGQSSDGSGSAATPGVVRVAAEAIARLCALPGTLFNVTDIQAAVKNTYHQLMNELMGQAEGVETAKQKGLSPLARSFTAFAGAGLACHCFEIAFLHALFRDAIRNGFGVKLICGALHVVSHMQGSHTVGQMFAASHLRLREFAADPDTQSTTSMQHVAAENGMPFLPESVL
eukprot:TRINITY_DN13492_c0_g1_i1.p1 TRINITY_DN13492_c0_g1~~TRINITY_DN13492_c0_g1_i1.p1  ORF type:complete len:1237 (-),score=261.76 TRINITY_DN13492_c0_g1_i1:506-4216(-)